MEMVDHWSGPVRGGDSVDQDGSGADERRGHMWEVSSLDLVMDWVCRGRGRCRADFWCLPCITGWMVVPFTEIKNLEKDQVWEGWGGFGLYRLLIHLIL